jgi:hypothetical protein
VKREAKIIVVVGNPPYDRFTGAAQSEEAELVAHYKGIQLVEDRNKDGTIKRDEFGRVKKKQRGESLLYKEFHVRKQLLDDLYVRFFRLAEERIGEAAEYGVMSYISNSSFLTGRSHPLMRRSLLSNYHAVWIDNLNGDKYRTGKIIPQGLPGAGTRDDSAFTTEMDPRGIQPGTAITIWVKRTGAKTAADATSVWYRDFWGPASLKRAGLLASLPTGVPPSGEIISVYEPLRPSIDSRWRLGPRTFEGGFEAWPSVEELLPTRLQGVNHNRGLEGGIIDVDRQVLEHRLHAYFSTECFSDAKIISEEIATPHARYEPESVWKKLKSSGHFKEDVILPFLVFPFDYRYIYYVPVHKWLNEARSKLARVASNNEWLITVPEPRKASETRPIYGTGLINLHVHERGSVVFPRETYGDDLLPDREANISEGAWRLLRDHFGLSGERRGEPARAFVGRLFRVAFAILHAPSYQSEHKSALSADWAHLPIPKDAELFARLVTAGERVVGLLDANVDARETIEAVIGPDLARSIGPLRRVDGKQVRPEDLKITVTYWGGGKGRWKPRSYMAEELPQTDFADAWGERTGDLFLNDDTFFANVPELVWTYQLGGYPVLKKWLSYRQADRRGGRPLADNERRWFRQIIQRIAAILALGPSLDALYQETSARAFTAEELGIVR